MIRKKIVIPGGAGLVGQNLVARLLDKGYENVIVLDKHRKNLDILKKVQPKAKAVYADLANPGQWQEYIASADEVVMLQAQIGGNDYEMFVRNNMYSTKLILDSLDIRSTHLVHVSSSVVESVVDDYYTNTKKAQEKIVIESGIKCPILRPTLMFGWFDRKHLGWLSRFLNSVPLFPIPGNGRYIRQPLYVGDFVNIIINCIERELLDGIYNISGHEKINYIDMIYEIKLVTESKSKVICVPYNLFYIMIWVWGVFDKNPPFTTQQLKALIAKDEFEVIDWPTIFDVSYTPFKEAIKETFSDPRYSNVILEF